MKFVRIALLFAVPVWGQDDPGPPEPSKISCTASAERVSIVRRADGRQEEWITYTARADKLLIYSKEVLVPNGGREKCKACDRAMAEAANECAKWVSERSKQKPKPKAKRR